MTVRAYRHAPVMQIERVGGKIALRPSRTSGWMYRVSHNKSVLLAAEFVAINIRTYAFFGAIIFFVVWLTDTSYWLWIVCAVGSVFSLAVTSKIVLYIKHKRGVI